MTVFRLGGGEGLGPALSGSAAGAACIERLLELVGVGQIGVGLVVYRHGLVDRAAERKRIERDRRVGAERLANLLHVRRIPAEIGDGKERAVTGAHADDVAPAERAPFRAFGAEIEPQRHALHSPRLRGSLRRCGLRRDGHASAPCAAAALRGRVASGQRQGEQGEAQRGAPHHVREVRKSTPRGAATREASQRRTTDMTVLATFTSLDYRAIILDECRRVEAKSERFLGQGFNAAH